MNKTNEKFPVLRAVQLQDDNCWRLGNLAESLEFDNVLQCAEVFGIPQAKIGKVIRQAIQVELDGKRYRLTYDIRKLEKLLAKKEMEG